MVHIETGDNKRLGINHLNNAIRAEKIAPS